MRVRWTSVLLACAGLGMVGCGGSTHARAASAPAAAPPPTAATRCGHAVPANLAAPGPYRVGSARIGLTRPATTSAQVRRIDPAAWFPQRRGGRCRFPLIVFSPGANSRPLGYVPLLTHLASEGFVVIGLRHEDRTARGDESVERVDDVTYLLDHLRAIAGRLAPGLPGELDATRIGIAGHSYGAFVASREAVSEPRIAAALTMAGPLRPGPAAATRVPVLSMAGGADRSVPAQLVRDYYDRLPAAIPHGYLQIAGGDHRAYGNRCVAERTCGIVGSYAASFFLTYLDRLRGAGRLLDPSARRPARVLLQTVRMP